MWIRIEHVYRVSFFCFRHDGLTRLFPFFLSLPQSMSQSNQAGADSTQAHQQPKQEDRYGGLRKTTKAAPPHRKFPSTNSTTYPISTPSEPDMEETIRWFVASLPYFPPFRSSVCTQIHTLLRHSCKHPKPNPKVIPIFCEDLKTLVSCKANSQSHAEQRQDVHDMNALPVPEISHMRIFVTYIMQQLSVCVPLSFHSSLLRPCWQQMDVQCCIICLVCRGSARRWASHFAVTDLRGTPDHRCERRASSNQLAPPCSHQPADGVEGLQLSSLFFPVGLRAGEGV